MSSIDQRRPSRPEPGVLDAAVRHVVDPVGRDVVDDDTADLELVEGLPGVREVVGEDAGLESERAVVDLAHGVREVGEREDDDERRERLVRADLGLDRDVLQDRGLEERAVGLAAGDDLAAELDRLVDPALRPLGLALVDHRPDVRVSGCDRVAELQGGDAREELLEEGLADVLVEVHPLDADADLAGVGERADERSA